MDHATGLKVRDSVSSHEANAERIEGDTESPAVIDVSTVHGSLHGPLQESTDILLEMSKNSAKFPYRPLDWERCEVRIVTLQPGADSDPVVCGIEYMFLDQYLDDPGKQFLALSYCWRSADANDKILLEGHTILVGGNLWHALYHLRSPKVPLRLWIDALCINQDDIPERNQQCFLMGQIYELAHGVIAWLGRERGDSKSAMQSIREITERSERSSTHSASSNANLAKHLPLITSLVTRDYWYRAWIVQDILQARVITIHCGSEILKWDDLDRFFQYVEHQLANKEEPHALHMNELRQTVAFKFAEDRRNKNRDVGSLLQRYHGSLTSDPRDRVFSLCGMLEAKRWVVDYSKSAEEVFRLLCGFSFDDRTARRGGLAKALGKALELSTE